MLRDITKQPDTSILATVYESGYSRNVFGVAQWASEESLGIFECEDRAEVFGDFLSRRNTLGVLLGFWTFVGLFYFQHVDASTADGQRVLHNVYAQFEQNNQPLFQKLKRSMLKIAHFHEIFLG